MDGRTDGPTDRRMDRRMDTTSYRDAWSHLKITDDALSVFDIFEKGIVKLANSRKFRVLGPITWLNRTMNLLNVPFGICKRADRWNRDRFILHLILRLILISLSLAGQSSQPWEDSVDFAHET